MCVGCSGVVFEHSRSDRLLLLCWPQTGVWWAGFAVLAYGLGAGLFTLARPWLVEDLFGLQHFGWLNARIAAAQGFARAAGPVVLVWLYELLGGTWLFAVLAGLLLALLLPVAALQRGSTRD